MQPRSAGRRAKGILEKLLRLEGQCPIFAEIPFFRLIPPTLQPRSKWRESLWEWGRDSALPARLLGNAFLPVDPELFLLTTLVDLPVFLGSGGPACVDTDYGMVVYRDDGRWPDQPLSLEPINRYRRAYRHVSQEPAALFSIGAHRAARVLPPEFDRGGNPGTGYELAVASREELDSFLGMLRSRVASLAPGYEVWLRGQPDDCLTEDLRQEAASSIWPWRSVQDRSLIPSLLRMLTTLHGNWPKYYAVCNEFAEWLSLPGRDDPTEGGRGPLPPVLPGEEWGVPAMTATTLIGDLPVLGRDYDHVSRDLRRLFFLQHYGIPSTTLDLTRDPDVALFFAQHRLEGSRITPVDWPGASPVVYVFLLHKGVDRFFDSTALAGGEGMVRVLRQKCGFLAGASTVNRNAYARFIGVRIRLEGPVSWGGVRGEHLFPGPDEDRFLARLLEFQKERGLERLRP